MSDTSKTKILTQDLTSLDNKIRELKKQGYIHKRGYSIDKITTEAIAVHLIEEATEYVSASIARDFGKKKDKTKGAYSHLLEEAADSLLTWLHLNIMNGLPLYEIIDTAEQTLKNNFTPPEK